MCLYDTVVHLFECYQPRNPHEARLST
jgi:hypothetical protein